MRRELRRGKMWGDVSASQAQRDPHPNDATCTCKVRAVSVQETLAYRIPTRYTQLYLNWPIQNKSRGHHTTWPPHSSDRASCSPSRHPQQPKYWLKDCIPRPPPNKPKTASTTRTHPLPTFLPNRPIFQTPLLANIKLTYCPPPTNSVRTEEEFETLNLLSSSGRQPLITLWTASWCPSCKQISPLLSDIVSSGVGEAEGGVGYAEIQLDSPTIGGLMMRYSIGSMPTLMAFDRQEAQLETRVTNVDEMRSRRFLEDWIRREASRQGMGGGGGSGGSLFSGLFGSSKS